MLIATVVLFLFFVGEHIFFLQSTVNKSSVRYVKILDENYIPDNYSCDYCPFIHLSIWENYWMPLMLYAPQAFPGFFTTIPLVGSPIFSWIWICKCFKIPLFAKIF